MLTITAIENQDIDTARAAVLQQWAWLNINPDVLGSFSSHAVELWFCSKFLDARSGTETPLDTSKVQSAIDAAVAALNTSMDRIWFYFFSRQLPLALKLWALGHRFEVGAVEHYAHRTFAKEDIAWLLKYDAPISTHALKRSSLCNFELLVAAAHNVDWAAVNHSAASCPEKLKILLKHGKLLIDSAALGANDALSCEFLWQQQQVFSPELLTQIVVKNDCMALFLLEKQVVFPSDILDAAATIHHRYNYVLIGLLKVYPITKSSILAAKTGKHFKNLAILRAAWIKQNALPGSETSFIYSLIHNAIDKTVYPDLQQLAHDSIEVLL